MIMMKTMMMITIMMMMIMSMLNDERLCFLKYGVPKKRNNTNANALCVFKAVWGSLGQFKAVEGSVGQSNAV